MADPKPRRSDEDALGHAIKVIRTGLGLDRKDLARTAGLSYSYVAEIETGRKPASSAAQQALARALGLSPSELLAAAEEWAVRLRGEPLEAAELAEPDDLEAPAMLSQRRAPTSSVRGARARQESWFLASSLPPWSSSRSPAASMPEDRSDTLSVEAQLAVLRKLLMALAPRDRERVVDLARRLARS